MNPTPFPHERLEAWHRAREARVLALAFTATLPPGFGEEARQINTASASVVRNLCEGAGRWRPAEKVLKFEIASGEASEAAGAVQSLLDCGVEADGQESVPICWYAASPPTSGLKLQRAFWTETR